MRSDAASRRYEVTVSVGPCSEAEVEDLMVTIAELQECQKVAGVVSSRRVVTTADIAGLVPDMTGGLSAEEYVRWLRGV